VLVSRWRRMDFGILGLNEGLARAGYLALLLYELVAFALQEVHYWLGKGVAHDAAWVRAAEGLLALGMALWVGKRAVLQKWPYFSGAPIDLRLSSLPVFGVAAVYAAALAVTHNGATVVTPFLPLLNPLDLALGVTVVTGVQMTRVHGLVSGGEPSKLPWIVLFGGAFVGLNVALGRALSNLVPVAYTGEALLHSPLVQGAYAVFWSVLGVLATVTASRRKLRTVWILGASLLGLVVVKLFLVDLSASSAVIRIVTFLAVGLLLIGVGYWAPVPPEKEEQK
jgi:uncharacterized membrane protein